MKKASLVVGLSTVLCLAAAEASAATVAGGYHHTLVVKSDGTVWGWGYNGYGQIGDGTTTSPRKTPVQTSGLTSATSVAAGVYHSLALKSDGTVWAWGYNGYGQLGDNTTTQRTSPVQVLTGATAIAAGDYHSVAVKSDGTVWAWGYNANGQIGDNTQVNKSVPTQVSSLSSVSTVGAGAAHTLAVKTDGTAWAWGNNGSGRLGDNTTTQRLTPVQVSGLSSAVSISGGSAHSLAVKSDGTLWAWGYNYYGQLGDSSNTQRLTPVQVSGLTSVSSASAGYAHSLAVKTDGSAWAWGYNNYGQLGDGTTTDRNAPVQVTDVSTISAVAASSQYHSAAVTTDGVVWTWGYNNYGQLGDGTTVTRKEPVAISDTAFNWKVATPAFSPVGGLSNYTQSVTISSATSGATIYYTTDGTTPTTSSSVYSSAVAIDVTTTLKALATKAGQPSSNVAADVYTLKVLAPYFTPAAGTYTTAQSVTIATYTAGATLRYTTDATEPTASSTLYTTSLSIGTTTTLKAKAFKSGWSDSDTTTGTYTMNFGTLAAPTMSPAGGTYESSVEVTLSGPSGATIRYTTNGTDPTVSSTAYSAPLTLTTTTTLKAKAFQVDWTASAITTATYTITVATPTLTPGSGTYAAGQLITISATTAGAEIRYTMSGVDPTTSDPLIPSGGTVVAGNYTLKAKAFKTGCTASGVTTAAYSVTGSLTPGALATGYSHILAVQSDGTAWAWGYDYYGELGDGVGGPYEYRYVADRVVGLTGVTAVEAGYYTSIALKNDGTVWTWGLNTSGQLGDGTTTGSRAIPYQVAISGVVAVAAGDSHMLALKSDGTLWAWGYNNSGQLGDGTTNTRTSPVQVPALTNVVAVAAGASHSLAVKSDGTIWAWGANGLSGIRRFRRTTTELVTTIRRLADSFRKIPRVSSMVRIATCM